MPGTYWIFQGIGLTNMKSIFFIVFGTNVNAVGLPLDIGPLNQLLLIITGLSYIEIFVINS